MKALRLLFDYRLQQLKFAFFHASRVGADKDVKLARLGVIFHPLVPELQRLDVDREADGAGFAWFKGHFFKALKLFHRTAHRRRNILHVHLHHRCAFALAGVGHLHAGGNGAVAPHGRGREFYIRHAEGGVAQAVTERIERAVGLIEIARSVFVRLVGVVRAARVQVAVVDRDLAHRAREGHRQFAGRVVIVKQHVGDGVTAFRTRKPVRRPGKRSAAGRGLPGGNCVLPGLHER